MVNKKELLTERGIASRLRSIKRLAKNIDTSKENELNKLILEYDNYLYGDDSYLDDNYKDRSFDFYDKNFGCYYFDIFGNVIVPGSYVIYNTDFGIGYVTSSDIVSLNIRTIKHKVLDRSLDTNVKFIKNSNNSNNFADFDTVMGSFNKNMPVIVLTDTEFNNFYNENENIYSSNIYDIIEKKCLDLYNFNNELLPHFVNIFRLYDRAISNNISNNFNKVTQVESNIARDISDFIKDYTNNIGHSLNLFEQLFILKNRYNYNFLNESVYRIKDLDGKLIKLNDMVVTKSIRLGNVVGFFSDSIKNVNNNHKVKIKYKNFNGKNVYGSQWSIKNLRVV